MLLQQQRKGISDGEAKRVVQRVRLQVGTQWSTARVARHARRLAALLAGTGRQPQTRLGHMQASPTSENGRLLCSLCSLSTVE